MANGVVHRAKVHANVCLEKPASYSEYDNFQPEWNLQEKYEVVRKVGRGKVRRVETSMQSST